MKLDGGDLCAVVPESHPARGAWIEIIVTGENKQATTSHPARGAWIEIIAALKAASEAKSHPARGAWIEMAPP